MQTHSSNPTHSAQRRRRDTQKVCSSPRKCALNDCPAYVGFLPLFRSVPAGTHSQTNLRCLQVGCALQYSCLDSQPAQLLVLETPTGKHTGHRPAVWTLDKSPSTLDLLAHLNGLP